MPMGNVCWERTGCFLLMVSGCFLGDTQLRTDVRKDSQLVIQQYRQLGERERRGTRPPHNFGRHQVQHEILVWS